MYMIMTASGTTPRHVPLLVRTIVAVLTVANVLVLVGVGTARVLHVSALPVLTSSMQPSYASGDAVLTRPVAVADLRPGMIVSVVPPGETRHFVHRILTVSGDVQHPTITTKGDANPAADGWRSTLLTTTVPRVVAVAPRLGAVVLALSTPRGHDLALSVLGLLLTLFGAGQIVALSRRPAPAHAARARASRVWRAPARAAHARPSFPRSAFPRTAR